MADKQLCGTVTYISNLYPIETNSIYDDSNFLQHIEDPDALSKMKKGAFKSFRFSERQEMLCHTYGACVYASKFEGIQWGAQLGKDGLIREICKCENLQCPNYKECMGN